MDSTQPPDFLQQRFRQQRHTRVALVGGETPALHPAAPRDDWRRHREAVRQRAIDLDTRAWEAPRDHADRIHTLLRQAAAAEPGVSEVDKERLYTELVATVLGWGPVDKLMSDQGVTEIMVDNPTSVGYMRDGRWYWLTDDFPNTDGARVGFADERDLRMWIERLLQGSERAATEENPLLDEDMEDGARLQVTVPPVSEYPTVNIRKSVTQTHAYHPKEYVSQNVWSEDEWNLLYAVTRGYANMIVAGPTGSGKTTIVRQLIEYAVSPEDRILSIEDIRETRANHPRYLSLSPVPRRENPVDFQQIFAATMRKTPTRVMVSELRSAPETRAFFDTISSGHPGAITSQHGEDPLDIIDMLVTRALEGGMGQIAEIVQRRVFRALDLIIFIKMVTGNRRRVTGVYELVPVELQEGEGASIRTLFRWDRTTDRHLWVADPLPFHLERWEFRGATIPRRQGAMA